MKTKYKWVSGYEGYYKISNCGELLSVDRLSSWYKGNSKKRHSVKGVERYPSVKHGKYRFCWLYKENSKRQFYIHRLVAQLFVPNPDKHTMVDHIDRNTFNNHYTNLRWVNRSSNVQNSKRVSKTGYRGVYSNKTDGIWYARIKFNNKVTSLGGHRDVKKAALAYNEAAKKIYGSNAKLNLIK